jgi:hypothetical protein
VEFLALVARAYFFMRTFISQMEANKSFKGCNFQRNPGPGGRFARPIFFKVVDVVQCYFTATVYLLQSFLCDSVHGISPGCVNIRLCGGRLYVPNDLSAFGTGIFNQQQGINRRLCDERGRVLRLNPAV